MDFSSKYKDLSELVSSALYREFSLIPDQLPSKISELMLYSLQAGGKRLRPVLCLAMAEVVGQSHEAALPFSLALEAVHTSTLIHDDLPALDNDSLRRGQPTAHVQFSEALAILGGDALIARAFLIIQQNELVSAVVRGKQTRLLAEAFFAVCEGQELDLCHAPTEKLQDKLLLTHSKKTGALLQAAVLGGLYLSDDETVISWELALRDYAFHLGLLFQITDDLLDVRGNSEKMGKSAGQDEKTGAQTYVSLLGIQGAEAEAQTHANQARAALEPLGDAAEFFKTLVHYVLTREA